MIYKINFEGHRENGLFFFEEHYVILKIDSNTQKLIATKAGIDYHDRLCFHSKRRGYTGYSRLSIRNLIPATEEEIKKCKEIMDNLHICKCCEQHAESVNSDGLCKYCSDNNAKKCEICGKWEFNPRVLITDNPDGMIACHACTRNLIGYDYQHCNRCGEIFHPEYTHLRVDGKCPTCNSDVNHHIMGYRDNPPVEFKNGENPKYDKLFFGFELEVDKGGYNHNASTKIGKIVGNDVFFKRDGSLTNGFEIVSQPMHYEYFMNQKENYAKMFGKAIDIGYCSHKTTTCGLHFHISRSALTETEIVKLVYLFEKHWENVKVFTRRSQSKLNSWASRYGYGHMADIEDKKIDKDEDESHDKLTQLKRRGRYTAINLTNEHTVEFRVFRGTLNINTFIASMQFIRHLVDMVKEYDIDALRAMSWSELMKNDFVELNEYLALRGLATDTIQSAKKVIDK